MNVEFIVADCNCSPTALTEIQFAANCRRATNDEAAAKAVVGFSGTRDVRPSRVDGMSPIHCKDGWTAEYWTNRSRLSSGLVGGGGY